MYVFTDKYGNQHLRVDVQGRTVSVSQGKIKDIFVEWKGNAVLSEILRKIDDLYINKGEWENSGKWSHTVKALERIEGKLDRINERLDRIENEVYK